jgi:LemA protein
MFTSLSTILLVVGIAIVLWAVVAYNGLVTLKNRVKEGWSDIDVQLKRRYDLIPNLVETVKGYAKHERETLDAVIAARAAASAVKVDASDVTHDQMAQFAAAQDGLSGALGKLFALSENYPDLKANTNFLELQRELTDTENKIQAARRFYNGTVRDYNTKIETVPTNIVANAFNFTQREFFEVEDAAQREVVDVKF